MLLRSRRGSRKASEGRLGGGVGLKVGGSGWEEFVVL